MCRICHEKGEQDDLGVFCDCKGSLAVSAICQMSLVIAGKTTSDGSGCILEKHNDMKIFSRASRLCSYTGGWP